MLTTTPLRRPVEAWVPTPMMSMPSSVTRPTIAAILVVPMSRPTMISSRLAIYLDPFYGRLQPDGDAVRPGDGVEDDCARLLAAAGEIAQHEIVASQLAGEIAAAEADFAAALAQEQRHAQRGVHVDLGQCGTRRPCGGRGQRLAHQRLGGRGIVLRLVVIDAGHDQEILDLLGGGALEDVAVFLGQIESVEQHDAGGLALD